MWLIINDDSDNAYEWTKVTSLGASLEFESLNVSYEWTVPSKISLERYVNALRVRYPLVSLQMIGVD